MALRSISQSGWRTTSTAATRVKACPETSGQSTAAASTTWRSTSWLRRKMPWRTCTGSNGSLLHLDVQAVLLTIVFYLNLTLYLIAPAQATWRRRRPSPSVSVRWSAGSSTPSSAIRRWASTPCPARPGPGLRPAGRRRLLPDPGVQPRRTCTSARSSAPSWSATFR